MLFATEELSKASKQHRLDFAPPSRTFSGEGGSPAAPRWDQPAWDQVDFRIRLTFMHAQTHAFTSIGPLDP